MSRRRKSRLLQRLEYGVYRGIKSLVRSWDDQAIQRWGSRLGRLSGRVLRGRDRLAMRNLAAVFPEKSEQERRRILDECWQHFGREALGYIRMQNMTLDEITARCTFVNEHLLDEALAGGRGVIVLSAHFGSWELGALAVMAYIPNVSMVARTLDNEYLDRDLSVLRSRTGAQVVDRRGAGRLLMKTLSAHGAVALLPDQAVIPREGVRVPFLGRPAWTTPVPAKLAARFSSPIVFASCIPDGARHRFEFEEVIRVDMLGDDEKEAVALTSRINDVLSRRIASRPELWLWMHDRWKGTDGE